MYLMLGKNISSTCKIRYVRCIASSYGGSIRGTHDIAHHAPTHSPLNLRPSGPAVHTQMRPPWAAHGTGATLSDATRILQTHCESALWSQPRHANRIASLESPSFYATEPLSRPKAFARMRRRRADRSCRARDTTFVQVSTHDQAHGGRRHTGWSGFGRHMPERFWPFADMVGT